MGRKVPNIVSASEVCMTQKVKNNRDVMDTKEIE